MLILVGGAQSLAQDRPAPTRTEIAPGIHLFRTASYGEIGLDGNSIAIISTNGVLVFDTNGTPSAATAVLAEIRKLTSQPYLPKEKIVITGDLLVNPISFALSSYPTGWLRTLEYIDGLDATLMVPGHGEPLRDKQLLHASRSCPACASCGRRSPATCRRRTTRSTFSWWTGSCTVCMTN